MTLCAATLAATVGGAARLFKREMDGEAAAGRALDWATVGGGLTLVIFMGALLASGPE